MTVKGQEETGFGDKIFYIMIVMMLTGLCSTLFKTRQIVFLNWEILMDANFTLLKIAPNKWIKENEEKLSVSLSGKEKYFSGNSLRSRQGPQLGGLSVKLGSMI